MNNMAPKFTPVVMRADVSERDHHSTHEEAYPSFVVFSSSISVSPLATFSLLFPKAESFSVFIVSTFIERVATFVNKFHFAPLVTSTTLVVFSRRTDSLGTPTESRHS